MMIVTIGGYGFSESGFIAALQNAHVDTFVDVRQRRGLRGPKYAFLNSRRLQHLLAGVGIKYVHACELAPTDSVRRLQKKSDQVSGVAKRKRATLSPEFVDKYRSEVLAIFNAEPLARELHGATVVALFCVEAEPPACHRSLAALHLVKLLGIKDSVEHLRA